MVAAALLLEPVHDVRVEARMNAGLARRQSYASRRPMAGSGRGILLVRRRHSLDVLVGQRVDRLPTGPTLAGPVVAGFHRRLNGQQAREVRVFPGNASSAP